MQKSEDSPQTPSASAAPYEAALTKAFDKLTSEILIFLLAYVILVIGLSVFKPQALGLLQPLLYAIPVLGVMGYGYFRKREIKKGIELTAGVVKDSARVVAVDNARHGDDFGRVGLTVGVAKGTSTVGGLVFDNEPETTRGTPPEETLKEIFRKLSLRDQIALIGTAQNLLDKEHG